MLLLSAVSISTILTAGTGAATVKFISAGLGSGNSGRVNETVGASVTIALIGGGLLATATMALFWWGADRVFGRMGDLRCVHITGLTAAVLIWIEQFDNAFSSTLKGAERYSVAARVEMLSRTGQIVATVLVLLAGGGLLAIYVAFFMTSLLRLMLKILATRQAFPEIGLMPMTSSIWEILRFSMWGWLHGIGGTLFGVADRFLVGSLLGAASLAHYAVASQLAMQIHGLAAAAISVVLPSISRRQTQRSQSSLARAAGIILMGNILVSSLPAVVLLLCGDKILTLWLGSAQAALSSDVLRYLVFAYWLLAINVTAHFVLLGLGMIPFVALSNLAAGTVSLALMWCLVQVEGLNGVGLARIAYGGIICANFVPLILHIIKERRAIRASAAVEPE